MLFLVSVGIRCSQQPLEPLEPRDSQDGDAAVAAERLKQGEVDLQRHIVFTVHRQDAQDHAVWISEEERERENEKIICLRQPLALTCLGRLGLAKLFSVKESEAHACVLLTL